MARVTKNQEAWHLVTLVGDHGQGEAVLVGYRKRCYLSCHAVPDRNGFMSISGTATLRKLAKAILREVGETDDR